MNLIKLRYDIENVHNLPTLPAVLRKLLVLVEDPTLSINELEGFIMKDPSLASRIIKAANSPLYGLPSRVTNINQALMLLGLNAVKGLLLGVSVFEHMERVMAGLWQHSAGCAIAARIIAEKTGHNDMAEDVSSAALLHDMGKVILGLKYPEKYQYIIETARNKQSYIAEEEKIAFEITHADVGAWLAFKWNFPHKMIDTIKYHHSPSLSKTAPTHTSIASLANILVKAIGFGFSGDNLVPILKLHTVKTLSLNEAVLREVVDELELALGDPEDFTF